MSTPMAIHEAGDVSAVFSFGDALVIKVRIANDNTRQEPETLAFLAEQQLSFEIPTVLYLSSSLLPHCMRCLE